jgi:hypothetical protein
MESKPKVRTVFKLARPASSVSVGLETETGMQDLSHRREKFLHAPVWSCSSSAYASWRCESNEGDPVPLVQAAQKPGRKPAPAKGAKSAAAAPGMRVGGREATVCPP